MDDMANLQKFCKNVPGTSFNDTWFFDKFLVKDADACRLQILVEVNACPFI